MAELGKVFGLLRPSVDAHTLGVSYVKQLLEDCGYKVFMADRMIAEAFNHLELAESKLRLKAWILQKNLVRLGVSYRLDPASAQLLFGKLHHFLVASQLYGTPHSPIQRLYFAGLPDACKRIQEEYKGEVGVFQGDETATETLTRLEIPLDSIPPSIRSQSAYDDARLAFGKDLIQSGAYQSLTPSERSGYAEFGTRRDSLLLRLRHAETSGQLPLLRVHVGPYQKDRQEALRRFQIWLRELSAGGFLDIVSIGSSQLSQSHFGESWEGLPNGGGVPVNSESEYHAIWENARPMLVRTYAGTKNIPDLARMYDRSINMAWHTLSFWWFSQIDGRGPHNVYQNLCEHFQALDYIARTGKPFEANVPHHFAFRGCDDVTYVVSAILAARAAKKRGVRCFILQAMLNTPKMSIGLQDLAKSRVMLSWIRRLEDAHFRVILQPRAGLDYFSPDLDKARVQLAAVSALMDDIEQGNASSPPVVHVVSYSEASHLADPPVIEESIRIVRQSLLDYRKLKSQGWVSDPAMDTDLPERISKLSDEVSAVLSAIEASVPDPYSPEGFYAIFAAGFLPVPYLWECREEFSRAVQWETGYRNGGISVLDKNKNPLPAAQRAAFAAGEVSRISPPYPLPV